MEPPCVAGSYVAVLAKGLNLVTLTSPFLVIVNALVLLSINLFDLQVNNCVFVTAVSGVVLGVNVVV